MRLRGCRVQLLLERVEQVPERAGGEEPFPAARQRDTSLPAAEIGAADDDSGMVTAERGEPQQLLGHERSLPPGSLPGRQYQIRARIWTNAERLATYATQMHVRNDLIDAPPVRNGHTGNPESPSPLHTAAGSDVYPARFAK